MPIYLIIPIDWNEACVTLYTVYTSVTTQTASIYYLTAAEEV